MEEMEVRYNLQQQEKARLFREEMDRRDENWRKLFEQYAGRVDGQGNAKGKDVVGPSRTYASKSRDIGTSRVSSEKVVRQGEPPRQSKDKESWERRSPDERS